MKLSMTAKSSMVLNHTLVNYQLHHAGTGHDEEGRLVASGGRVLASTGIAASLEEARDAAYDLLAGIELEGSHYRRDIGHRAL